MRIGLLCSRIRVEERLLIDEFERRSIDHDIIDVRTIVFDVHEGALLPGGRRIEDYDVFFERCISQTQATAAARLVAARGVPCINHASVIETCGDKLQTSIALVASGVPTPRVKVALEPESALDAIEQNGYPAVLKPTVGSWGRLLARINDRDAAEAIVEHKSTLGSVQHSVFYIQEHVDKPGRDLRVFMVGDEPIAAIARASEHWITNTARGGSASRYEIGSECADLCRRAARAVASNTGGGAILAIDLLEDSEGRLLVSEVNHTMEFRNSIEPTGVDIPGRMIDFVCETGRSRAGMPGVPA